MPDAIKTRYPQKLYHKDYFTFVTNVSTWCDNHAGDPDYPAHLTVGFSDKVDALGEALDIWDGLDQAQKGKSAIFTDRATLIAKQLQLIKDLLPTTIDNPPVLADFGLDRKIPEDRDDLFFVAQTCVGHWVDITGGGVPPEYTPLEGDFVTLQSMFTAFETAKSEHFAAMNAAQEAQNDVLTTREACNEQERKIFNWYGARYSDPKDEWWTGTWWGASGGGGEPPAPEWPDWPGPVEASIEQIDEGLVRITYSGLNGGATLTIERMMQGESEWTLCAAGLPIDDPENLTTFDDGHLDKKKYVYKLTPFNEDEDRGTAVEIEIDVKE